MQNVAGTTVEVVVVDNCPDRSAAEAVRHAMRRSALPIRYVHEPRPGVSHARNTGICTACGRFVAFLDDDETASRGWLSALLTAQKRTGADVVHGPVIAALPDGDIAHADLIGDFFTRELTPGSPEAWHRTGIGNCLLAKDACFPDDAPFDPAMGQIGGEDSLLLQHLADRNLRFASAPDGIVYEHVPPHRATIGYVLLRKFRTSQIHTLVTRRKARPAAAETAKWMTIGAAQFAVFAPAAVLAWLIRRRAWPRLALKAVSGLGKLLWMQPLIRRAYGGARRPSDEPEVPPAPPAVPEIAPRQAASPPGGATGP